MDRTELAGFLRLRREALRPEDVGLGRGQRRRTVGLRREEVAALADMSTDYYARLEQARGPQPSPQMLGSIARALRLSRRERDHLFRLAGHQPPLPGLGGDHVSPGLMRILDRLADTPAQVINALDETLAQTQAAAALLGDDSQYEGVRRSRIYRWFTEPDSRAIYPEADHPMHSRVFTALLRRASARFPGDARVGGVVEALLGSSEEFARLWAEHEVSPRHDVKRISHPELGVIEVQCQVLEDDEHLQLLLVYTATPGTPDAEKLDLLSVVGRQQLAPGSARGEEANESATPSV